MVDTDTHKHSPIDLQRRFVLSYFMMDDTMQVGARMRARVDVCLSGPTSKWMTRCRWVHACVCVNVCVCVCTYVGLGGVAGGAEFYVGCVSWVSGQTWDVMNKAVSLVTARSPDLETPILTPWTPPHNRRCLRRQCGTAA